MDDKTLGRLCITRREGDGIILRTPAGELIEVWFYQFDRGSTKVMVIAPKNVRVDRHENLDLHKLGGKFRGAD
jgi:sRNA-binding carbon storage regulator CsrA